MQTSSRPNTTVTSIKEFIRAVLGDWLTRMSGPLSVPAAIAALWVPNGTAKILLGLTAIAAFCVTAFRLWKSEHDKMAERDQRQRQLLDEIAALRETMVRYRIEMEADYLARLDQLAWRQKYNDLEAQIAAKIEELTSKAEATTYRNRGNIPRASTRP